MPDSPTPQPHSVITIRGPRDLHDTLRVMAFENRMSLNQFCVRALRRRVEELQKAEDHK